MLLNDIIDRVSERPKSSSSSNDMTMVGVLYQREPEMMVRL